MKWHEGEPPEGVDNVLVWDHMDDEYRLLRRGSPGWWEDDWVYQKWPSDWRWLYLPDPPEDT